MNNSEDVIDPVCGMTIRKARAPLTKEYGGVTFYFCSFECSVRFDADAEAYAAVSRLGLPGWGETPHPDRVVKKFRPE